MICAAGFAEVLRTTGDIPVLVNMVQDLVGGSQPMAALMMLLVGLLITMGIGSSFSTVPIIATLYVPLAMAMGFSPLATAALVGTAGGLGDAGSPASDSTIGPTAGLNADGQHDHIRDLCYPNLPALQPANDYLWLDSGNGAVKKSPHCFRHAGIFYFSRLELSEIKLTQVFFNTVVGSGI